MPVIFTLIGWPLALGLLVLAVLSVARIARRRQEWLVPQAWYMPLAAGSALFAVLALLGVAGPLAGTLIAGGLAAVLAWLAQLWTRAGWHRLYAQLRAGLSFAGETAAGIGGRLAGSRGGEPGQDSPAAVVAEAVAARGIPSVMEDAHLGAAPAPADVGAGLAAAGVPVPEPWANLAAWIAGREPADDLELRMFTDGDAAGALAVAEAYHAYGDVLLNGVRLSPAYVAGILEAGDSAAGHASLLAQVHKRFGVIYGAVKEWISAHGPLPKGDFLSDDL